MAERKTLVDIADHGAKNFVCIQALKRDVAKLAGGYNFQWA